MVATLGRVNYATLSMTTGGLTIMAKPRLFLIALGGIIAVGSALADQSPSPSSPPATGIEGSISISPIRGGPAKAGVPNSRPLRNTQFVVENAGSVVVSFTTNEEGRFRVPLAPGRYTIRAAVMKKIGRCGPFEVEVDGGGFKKVDFACDSGMR